MVRLLAKLIELECQFRLGGWSNYIDPCGGRGDTRSTVMQCLMSNISPYKFLSCMTETGPVGDCPVTDVRRREADVGSFNPWRKSHGRLFGRALSDGLSLAISAVSRTSDGHKSGLIALNAPGTFRRLQGFSSCKQIVSAPAVRDWSGQAMFHRIFVHLHTSGSPFAKYGSWLAPAQPHQDQFCESSIGVLIV